MEKYVIIFVLFALISEYEGQFQIADVSGPINLGNARSVNGKDAKVVNIVNGREVDGTHTMIISSGTNGPVVITKSSSTSTGHTGNQQQKGNRAQGLFEGTNGPVVIIGHTENHQKGNKAQGLLHDKTLKTEL